MAKDAWLIINECEKTMLLEALASYLAGGNADQDEIDALAIKLGNADAYPRITVGVHGGQVQWAEGNPFPIRICDYDGMPEDLPAVDERGQRCRMWFEPADSERKTS